MTAQSRATDRLTGRQVEILRLVADGLADREIGPAVYLSETTVRTHILDIRHKLGAVNRAHAVHLGHQMGILS